MVNLFWDHEISRGSVLLHKGCVVGVSVIWFSLRGGVSRGKRKIYST